VRHAAALAIAAAVLALGPANPAPGTAARTSSPIAVPVAHVADGFVPNDFATAAATGGTDVQWNFDGQFGVGAPGAWGNLIAAGAPGGAGVTVAVLDTGVAYTDSGPYRRSPDLSAARFVPGWDFVDGDPYPLDPNGHGTHVASTIAEETDNGFGLTGLAYGAQIMPVRVLDRRGFGDATVIARGVQFAVDHGAKVVNLSLTFAENVSERQIPDLLRAIEYAHERGVVVVAAAGNDHASIVALPARAPHVVAVGGTTEYGCLARYSNTGEGLDLVAPGGGTDAAVVDDPHCVPGRHGRAIYQIDLRPPWLDRFLVVPYAGTSMAAPHVAATAALVIASHVLGSATFPDEIEARLTQTARDLGSPGYDTQYGFGLLDAAAATAPSSAPPALPAADRSPGGP
jgi:serine protease